LSLNCVADNFQEFGIPTIICPRVLRPSVEVATGLRSWRVGNDDDNVSQRVQRRKQREQFTQGKVVGRCDVALNLFLRARDNVATRNRSRKVLEPEWREPMEHTACTIEFVGIRTR
jgi:hypothetical protein